MDCLTRTSLLLIDLGIRGDCLDEEDVTQRGSAADEACLMIPGLEAFSWATFAYLLA